MNDSRKVQSHHLERDAYLYVRQSSMKQVLENIESTKRPWKRGLLGRVWREARLPERYISATDAQRLAACMPCPRGRGNNGFFEGTSTCRRVVADHPTTVGLPATTFSYTGNIDNVDYTAPSTVVLVRCLWPSGNDDPVSWYRIEELGRVFFTSFAKEVPDLTNPTIGTPHIVAGLAWVLRR